MNLINSKIIPSSENTFWQTLPDKWTGISGQKRVLVLTQPFANNSEEDQTLSKMLGGCGLTQENYHILKLEENDTVAWHVLHEAYNPAEVLLLGIEPARLGISALFRFNEPNRFAGCTFIPSLSLQQLQQFPDAKKSLWLQALKPTFLPQ